MNIHLNYSYYYTSQYIVSSGSLHGSRNTEWVHLYWMCWSVSESQRTASAPHAVTEDLLTGLTEVRFIYNSYEYRIRMYTILYSLIIVVLFFQAMGWDTEQTKKHFLLCLIVVGVGIPDHQSVPLSHCKSPLRSTTLSSAFYNEKRVTDGLGSTRKLTINRAEGTFICCLPIDKSLV